MEDANDNPAIQGTYTLTLCPDNGGNHLTTQVDHRYTRERLAAFLERRYGAISMVAVYSHRGELYPWYTGSFLPFMPLVAYSRHLTICFGLRHFEHEAVAIQLDGETLGVFHVPPSVMERPDFAQSVYLQCRSANPNLPPPHLLREEQHLQSAPTAFEFHRVWAKRHYSPIIIGGTSLMNILYIPVELLGMSADLCPRCRRGFMECGRCMGGFYTYILHDGSTHTERVECLNAPGEQEGVGDGFSDRARLQTGGGSRYRKRYHFQETITSVHGTQDTAIDPRIVEDVRSHAALRGWETVTAQQVKEILMTLESYYRNVYDKWYQDAQLIASLINGDSRIENAIPIIHQRQMVEIYDSAVFAWKSCPASVRGNRRNFLQNNYNIWVVCTIAAEVHHEPRFLDYRRLVMRPDGSPPRLRDDHRQHEYENIWRWIIERNHWGNIEI